MITVILIDIMISYTEYFIMIAIYHSSIYNRLFRLPHKFQTFWYQVDCTGLHGVLRESFKELIYNPHNDNTTDVSSP